MSTVEEGTRPHCHCQWQNDEFSVAAFLTFKKKSKSQTKVFLVHAWACGHRSQGSIQGHNRKCASMPACIYGHTMTTPIGQPRMRTGNSSLARWDLWRKAQVGTRPARPCMLASVLAVIYFMHEKPARHGACGMPLEAPPVF